MAIMDESQVEGTLIEKISAVLYDVLMNMMNCGIVLYDAILRFETNLWNKKF